MSFAKTPALLLLFILCLLGYTPIVRTAEPTAPALKVEVASGAKTASSPCGVSEDSSEQAVKNLAKPLIRKKIA